jgi:hypothetical protein
VARGVLTVIDGGGCACSSEGIRGATIFASFVQPVSVFAADAARDAHG